jgi:putative Ca2+/H+ antiporter (TMEM165/GDT1 family)
VEWLTGALAAFAVVVPVELPDKTFVATLVLSTRYRPWPVWAGAAAAFAVQCVLAGTAGRLVALLPTLPVRIVVALLFLAGAVLLVRGARAADQDLAEQEQKYAHKAGGRRTGWRAFGATFLVLFLAEWGDLSQLLTVGLVASGRPVVPVVVGAWLGLATVAGLGVLLGGVLLRYVRLQIIRYVGAAICLALAALTVAAIVGDRG